MLNFQLILFVIKFSAAKPAQVQADVSAIESNKFQPSPELNTLYNSQNELRDHFHPTNQYYKPFNQDARYNYETTFNRNPLDDSSIETKWLGASDLRHNSGNRNTHVHASEPYYKPHVLRHQPYHSKFQENHQQDDRKIAWPNDVHVSKEEVRTPVWLNQFRTPESDNSAEYPKTKGSWKWIPEEHEEIRNLTQSKVMFNGPSSYYPPPQPEYAKYQLEYIKPQNEYTRPQNEYTQPYSFDSQDFLPHFSQFFSTLMGHKNTGATIVTELPDPRQSSFTSSGHGEIVIPHDYQTSFASTKEDEPSKEITTEVKTKP